MRHSIRTVFMMGALSVLAMGLLATPAMSEESSPTPGPAQGYDIHVTAPHLMPDGTPGGPYHH
ncbi:MAG: hypothetical protein WAU17_20375, partial [Nitrospirales bacterium]